MICIAGTMAGAESMQVGQTRDWREVLRETTGQELTAEPMLRYFQPVMTYLEEANRGRSCELPEP